MLPNSFAVQLSHAVLVRLDGADPRPEAVRILRELRVPAALRDATATWSGDDDEAGVSIPVTDAGNVLALDDEDRIVAGLTAGELRAAFSDAGMVLWLGAEGEEDGLEDLWAESGSADEQPTVLPEEDIEIDPALFETTVLVDSFSHRGPGMARATAQIHGAAVDYLESGAWSLQRYAASDPSSLSLASGAELPVIELNRPGDGSDWFEVTTSAGAVPFWPGSEQDTLPVLDLDAITVPETAELISKILREGDGSRDDLVEVAAGTRLDIDAAHAALLPESLGGIIGAEARERAFLAAFGVPQELIDAAFDEATELAARRMEPEGWWPLLGEILVEGASSLTPLTRRDRPLARLGRAIRRRPLLGAAISAGELASGAALMRRRGFGRVLGILLVVDAVADLVIWAVRARRSR